MSKFLENLMSDVRTRKCAFAAPEKVQSNIVNQLNNVHTLPDHDSQRGLTVGSLFSYLGGVEKNALGIPENADWQPYAAAAIMPLLAAAGMGGIGGALSPRGSGLLPGAARGIGAGVGAELGLVGGHYANQALIDSGHPNLGIAAQLALPVLGGFLGYKGTRAATRTTEEELRNAMLDYYHNQEASPNDDTVPPPPPSAFM